jgi:proliferating cell nuclear antigen
LLKNSIKDIALFSDRITLHVDGTRFEAFAEGDFGDSQINYLHGEKIELSVQSTYSLAKVKETLKADKFSDSVILELGTDMPLGLSLETEGACLRFLIAPRVESEE